jgi:hypothetical protein
MEEVEAMQTAHRPWPRACRYALLAVGSILTLSICRRLWLEYDPDGRFLARLLGWAAGL